MNHIAPFSAPYDAPMDTLNAPEDLKTRIGHRIHTMRRRRHLSQAQLGFLCGIERSRLSRIESGHYAPSVEEVVRLASFFDLSLDDLVSHNQGHR